MRAGQRQFTRWVYVLLCAWIPGLHKTGCAQATSLLQHPTAVAYDAEGNLYIADSGRHQVLQATVGGQLQVYAGNGTQGFTGDGGQATAAELNDPEGLAVGADGNVYIADTGNARIRVVAGGHIATLAGTGLHTFGGDGGAPAAASFREPAGLALDNSNGLLVCDKADHRVRRLGLGAGGVVTTIAGTGVQGFSGDGSVAQTAELDTPLAVVVDGSGRILIADAHNQRVRAIAASGVISTLTGGPGAPTALAKLDGLVVEADGTVLLADTASHRVLQTSAGGALAGIAGNGTEGTASDGALALASSLDQPVGLALSSLGMPTFAEVGSRTVRVLTPQGLLFQPAALAQSRAASQVQANFTSAQSGQVVYGTVSASVQVHGAVGTPQGSVALLENGSVLASAGLESGAAVTSSPTLDVGSHTLVAAYSGDGLNPAAQSTPLPLQVTPLMVEAAATPATVLYGEPLPVFLGSLAGVLSQDEGQVAVTFAPAASAQTTTALMPVGRYALLPTLTGTRSANYLVISAAGSGSLEVTPATSTVVLNTPAQSYAGLPLEVTAHVASATRGQPTGTVQFFDGGTAVASALLTNGSASALLAAAVAGQHSLVARYSGDGNFISSSSVTIATSVLPMPDFTLSLAGATTLAGMPGGSTTIPLLVSAQPGPFTGNVTFAVSGLPRGASGTFSPPEVVPGGVSVPVTLTVQLPASLAYLQPLHVAPAVGLAGVLGLGLLGFAGRQRRALWLLAGCIVLVGCGARTVTETVGGVTAIPVQITATSTNMVGAVVSHSCKITLTVQE